MWIDSSNGQPWPPSLPPFCSLRTAVVAALTHTLCWHNNLRACSLGNTDNNVGIFGLKVIVGGTKDGGFVRRDATVFSYDGIGLDSAEVATDGLNGDQVADTPLTIVTAAGAGDVKLPPPYVHPGAGLIRTVCNVDTTNTQDVVADTGVTVLGGTVTLAASSCAMFVATSVSAPTSATYVKVS